MTTIFQNIQQVRARMAAACAEVGRPVHSVTLLTVSKTFDEHAVREAYAAGERRFGENYVQEALDKIARLADLRDQIEWHLIGPLQSNKTRVVAEQFDWVHSVDRLKIAQRLSEQRPAHLKPLQVCLQVNVSGESSKSGLDPAELAGVAAQVAALPRLTLRGLMSIPEAADTFEAQRAPHRVLRELMAALHACGLGLDTPTPTPTPAPVKPTLDTLSMGMTADLEAAIAEGATMVRVGSAIFGRRPG